VRKRHTANISGTLAIDSARIAFKTSPLSTPPCDRNLKFPTTTLPCKTNFTAQHTKTERNKMTTTEISRPRTASKRTPWLQQIAPFSHLAANMDGGIIAGHGACEKCDCGGFVPNDPPDGRCEWCNHSFHVHEGVLRSAPGSQAGPIFNAWADPRGSVR